jgi:hypothetical protein
MILSGDAKNSNALQEAENLIAAYNDSLERILGAPKGSLHLMDAEALKEWFPLKDTLQEASVFASNNL